MQDKDKNTKQKSGSEQKQKKTVSKSTTQTKSENKSQTKQAKSNNQNVSTHTSAQGEAVVEKKSFIKNTLTSVVFWSVLFAVFVLLLVFNVFGTKPASPDEATASLQLAQNIRYGTQSGVSLVFDKQVSFGDGEVVWSVDGVEVQRGSATQKQSFELNHNFDSVGKHKVMVEVEGYPNLTTEAEVDVQRPLLVIDVQDSEKVYGEDNPVVKYHVSGFVDNDTINTVKLQTPQFAATKESDVGEYGIVPISHEKYDVEVSGGKLVIKQKALTLTANNASKIYDGNTSLSDANFAVSGTVGQDEVFVDVKTATFVDKNVGKNKKINIGDATLLGKDAKNYRLSQELSANGEIVAKNVMLEEVEVADKHYDGCTSVTFDSLGRFNGVVGGDDVSIGQIVARFETPSVGKQKRVLVDNIVLVGKDAKNYVIEAPQDLVAEIKGDSNVIKSDEIISQD